MKSLRPLAFALSAGLAALLFAAGCAVVTVDVDVYKGPLANTEEIQGEQLISMAMGAKPLLIQLRDYLEAETRLKYDKTPEGSPRFTDHQASLNDFRSKKGIYKAGYMPSASISEATIYRFKNEQAFGVNNILGLYEDRTNPVLKATIEEARFYLDEYVTYYDIFEPTSNAEASKYWDAVKKELPAEKQEVISDYDEFFRFQRADKKYRSETAALKMARHPDLAKEREDAKFVAQKFDIYKTKALKRDATDLFGPDKSPDKAEFVRRVTEVIDAYEKSRTPIRKLLRLMLINIAELDATTEGSSYDLQWMKTAAGVASKLIHRSPFTENHTKTAFPLSERIRKSRVYAEIQDASARSIDDEEWQEKVAKMLIDRPAMATELLRLDEELGQKAGSFGLAHRLQPLDEDKLLKPEDLARYVDALIMAADGPLNKGRLSDGIETIIEKYLVAARQNDFSAALGDLKSPEGKLLLATLVGFGQKVAQLGNSAVLLESNDSAKKYTIVLQAVGSSILVQADELKQQARHHESLEKWANPAKQTLKDAADEWPDSEEFGAKKFNAKDAALQLENALRVEYVTLLKTEPKTSDKAKNLLSAIEAVTEMRAGMIYLRPASAYLRGSYPASVAGHTNSQHPGNLLVKQTLRPIPFLGSWEPQTEKNDRAIFMALDKQTWQPINRVRVAGSGKVNYVIAKDDIGNWYVKQYGSDRKKAFEALKNLALFSSGDAFGTAIPLKNGDGSPLIKGDAKLDAQILKALQTYSEALNAGLQGLTTETRGLETTLVKALAKPEIPEPARGEFKTLQGGELRKLQTAVEAAEKELAEKPEASANNDKVTTISTVADDIKKKEAACLTLGEALVAYATEVEELVLQTDATKPTEANLAPVRQKVAPIVLGTVQTQIDSRFTRMRDAAHSLQQSLDVIKSGQ